MIRYPLIALATTALFWGTASSVQAQIVEVEPTILAQRGPDDRGPDWLQQLDLSPDQIQEMRAIRDRYRPQLDANHEQLKLERDELMDLLSSNASTTAIRQQQNQIQDLQQALEELRFESILEIREILTLEQRQQAAELLGEKRDQAENFRDRELRNR